MGGFISLRSVSTENETAVCAIILRRAMPNGTGSLGAISTSWWVLSESARGEGYDSEGWNCPATGEMHQNEL